MNIFLSFRFAPSCLVVKCDDHFGFKKKNNIMIIMVDGYGQLNMY